MCLMSKVRGSCMSVDTAMALYGLNHCELVWEKATDTKMLLAWSSHTLIIAFRGTASMKNVMADLRVR